MVIPIVTELPHRPEDDRLIPPGCISTKESAHRKPSNSCQDLKKQLMICLQHSKCFQSGTPFEQCLNSRDPDWVGQECLALGSTYALCRKKLLNPARRFRGNSMS